MTRQRFDDGLSPPIGALFANPEDPIPTGTELLGKYTLERTLGKGGMGIVVAARHHDLGELYAIKFLLPNALSSPLAIERFLREARAAARLRRSEHVVPVHDVGSLPNSGEPYMVMDYLEGQDLKTVLRSGPLAIADAVEYLLHVAEGLAEAHRNGIIHRDLKPANLFMTLRPNGSACVKVLDFGIAKVMDPDESDITQQAVLGSLKYMSPEQLLKSSTVDVRTDIWSWGVVAYEFLTGRAPFDGNQQEVISSIMRAEPERPRAIRGDLPLAIEAVVLRCLQKNREQRYATIQAVDAALRHAAGIPTTVSGRTPSLSMLVPPGLPVVQNNERPNATISSISITNSALPRMNRVKVGFVAGGALVMSLGVIGLVGALLDSSEKRLAELANAKPEGSIMAMILPPPVVPPFETGESPPTEPVAAIEDAGAVDAEPSDAGSSDAGLAQRRESGPGTRPSKSPSRTTSKNPDGDDAVAIPEHPF